MARVLFIANAVVNFTKYSFDSFYEGFINSLTRNGNDVYFLKANLFLDQSCDAQNFQLNVNKKKLVEYIKNITPELIITFNNNITDELLANTDCPVVFWSSESFDFVVSKDLIIKYESRYLFLHFDEGIRKQFIENLSLNPKSNIATFLSTDVRPRTIEQDKNISFLGTLHGNKEEFRSLKRYLQSDKQRKEISRYIDKIKSMPLEIESVGEETAYSKKGLMNAISRHQRMKILDELSDLGLCIYGDKKWLEIFDSYPELSLTYRDGYVWSLEQVSDLYNSSKISINVPHLQSIHSLSYRCPDILASNAVLLNRGKMSKQYDPKGLIPYFTTASEARELAIKLLTESNRRFDIVGYCHEIVDEKLRFERRLKEIEDLLSISLLSLNREGKYVFIDPDEFKSFLSAFTMNICASTMKILPKSAMEFIYKLLYPIKQIVPEEIKRIYRNKE